MACYFSLGSTSKERNKTNSHFYKDLRLGERRIFRLKGTRSTVADCKAWEICSSRLGRSGAKKKTIIV
jgi:hypothetical protein